MDGIIYLDHAAATPVDRRVLDAMLPYIERDFYNPSSPYAPAVKVRRECENAKHILAQNIGAKPAEIIITSGATESINLAFFGIKGHVITSNIEHQAVLMSAKKHDYTLVKANKYGQVVASDVKEAIRPDTEIVSIALANNELGTLQPIREIAEIVIAERQLRLVRGDKRPIYMHCDASQGVGQIDVNVARLGLDMMTVNSGKIYGPKGVGMLWVSSQAKIEPMFNGGGQENGMRSGTENVAGVIGFAKALDLVNQHRKYEVDRLRSLRDELQATLQNAFPESVVSGHPKHRLSGHLHISFPGLDGERLVFLLENQGVLIATGSACAANKATRSHVLMAIGMSSEVADGSVRITLGHLSTDDNIKRAGEIIKDVVAKEYERVKHVS